MNLDDYLAFAIQTAVDAGGIALAHFQTGVAVELKPDRSPVTLADRGAEQAIRQAIAERFPDHAVVGEEYGADGRQSDLQRGEIHRRLYPDAPFTGDTFR